MSNAVAELARRRNGLPRPVAPGVGLGRRVLTSGWTWVGVGATLLFAAALLSQYLYLTADVEVESGIIPGINPSAMVTAAGRAWPTLLVWSLIFLWADRYRPQRLLVWYLALGWGGAIATFLSIHINTWAATQLAVVGNGDPTTSARSAIFVAPFVEEATKATVLFLLAIVARYRLTSKLSLVALAGLSGIGFAFTENIIYYSRAILYASENISVTDPVAALDEIVSMRGFWTSFAHPLFTIATGIGIAIALRTRSKVVRVLAPLVGFLIASFLHMFFNSQATLADESTQQILYFFLGMPILLGAAAFVVRSVLKQGRLIRTRLFDYVQVGWLPESDPVVLGKQLLRFRALRISLSYGLGCFAATIRLQRTLTELAYLRDGQVLGLYDTAANERARELVDQAEGLRRFAIGDPRGMKAKRPDWWVRWRERQQLRRAQRAIPQTQPGIGIASGPGFAPPLGSPGYSEVDPRWRPPGS